MPPRKKLATTANRFPNLTKCLVTQNMITTNPDVDTGRDVYSNMKDEVEDGMGMGKLGAIGALGLHHI